MKPIVALSSSCDDLEPVLPEKREEDYSSFSYVDSTSQFRGWDISKVPVPRELTPEQEEMARAFIEMQEELADKSLTKYLLEQGMELSAIKELLARIGGR